MTSGVFRMLVAFGLIGRRRLKKFDVKMVRSVRYIRDISHSTKRKKPQRKMSERSHSISSSSRELLSIAAVVESVRQRGQQMRCSDLRYRFVSRLGTARGTTIGTSSVIEVSQQAEGRNRLYSVSCPHLYTWSLAN